MLLYTLLLSCSTENANEDLNRSIADEMVSSEDLLEKENQWVSDEGECSIGFTPSSTSLEDQEQQPSQAEKNVVIENLEKATSSLSVESLALMKTNELFEAHQKLLSMANAVATAMKRRCSSPDKS